MTCHDEILGYHSNLSCVCKNLTSGLPSGTPLYRVTGDIREMILSYLSDAVSFREKGDIVNEYASLVYAHGWLDAGLYLGYLSGYSPCLYLPGDDLIPAEDLPRLHEKTLRYEKMLCSALNSVEIAPESGSPLFQAAQEILNQGKKACQARKKDPDPCIACTAALGYFSYEYGWLDTGLRAGIFRILANPELFTTETSRLV